MRLRLPSLVLAKSLYFHRLVKENHTVRITHGFSCASLHVCLPSISIAFDCLVLILSFYKQPAREEMKPLTASVRTRAFCVFSLPLDASKSMLNL